MSELPEVNTATPESPTRYKLLDGTSGAYGHGDYTDYLPRGKRPGKWLPKVNPAICRSGYHVCRDLSEVLAHIGPDLYLVEARGQCVNGDNKAAYEQIRLLRRVDTWTEETQRLFAVDCARIAVNRYAQDDQRELLHACLDVTVAAARDAARDAAGDAAWAAAWAAASAAARDAAWDAASAAAGAAAWDAAWAAAGAEEASILARYLAGEQGPFVEEGEA